MRINATDKDKDPDKDWKKYLFPCDCGNTEYLYISWWTNDPDDKFEWAYLEVVPTIWAASLWGWRDRLKAIARIIAGRPHYHGGIILNQETVDRLRETLDELELDEKRERQVKQDGENKHIDEDEYIHQDADT